MTIWSVAYGFSVGNIFPISSPYNLFPDSLLGIFPISSLYNLFPDSLLGKSKVVSREGRHGVAGFRVKGLGHITGLLLRKFC